MQRRIKRNYRSFRSPSKALGFCQKVKHALTDNPNFPDSTWGDHITSRQQYSDAVNKFELAYNVAINGDRLLIMERDKIWDELVLMLDQIASHLETVSARNSDALYSTGFDIASERRSSNRSRLPLSAAPDFRVVNGEQRGRAIGSASHVHGAYNYEIHLTDKDPSVEENWLHKVIAHDPSHMEMDNVTAGNLCFRMRAHGPDGPGPWSAIVTATIS